MNLEARIPLTRPDERAGTTKPVQVNGIAIIDLGGQYCHMISRRLRDIGVHADVLPAHTPASLLSGYRGLILSGGPQSVYEPSSPRVDPKIVDLGLPVLGICYGHQLLAHMLGCTVAHGQPEYGSAALSLSRPSPLFANTGAEQTVWMSHGDSVTRLAPGIEAIARTRECAVAAFECKSARLYGLQFHPEVAHSDFGAHILENFARVICGIEGKEDVEDLVGTLLQRIRDNVGNRSVLFFVSGGVDSTVAFALCAKALPPSRVLGVYVDTGLMRKNETEELRKLLGTLGLSASLKIRDESKRFVSALHGVVDPEEKRKIIGKLFIDVQTDAMKEYGIDGGHWLLGQGTIYPDTIESGGASSTTALIKTHHNRCPEVLELIAKGGVIEPLAEFYKDEVRAIGAKLGLDERLTGRWPFPGPGLAIRCLCWDGDDKPAKAFDLPPGHDAYRAAVFHIKTVGVQGDARTYRDVAAVVGPIDYDKLQALSSRLCNSSKAINRVVIQVAGRGPDLLRGRVTARTISKDRLDLLREAEQVMRDVMEQHGLIHAVWQFPTILIPVSFDGGETIILRPVNSQDGMTADFGRLPVHVLKAMGEKIMAIGGIDAVMLDVTNKPPATIEWE